MKNRGNREMVFRKPEFGYQKSEPVKAVIDFSDRICLYWYDNISIIEM